MNKYLFFLLIISSCSEKTINKEVEVIDDVFLELVGTDYYYKQSNASAISKDTINYNEIELRQKLVDGEITSNEFFKTLEEWVKIDTTNYDDRKLIFVLNDSLIGFLPFNTDLIEPSLWGDTIHNSLVLKLFDTSLVTQGFNIADLEKTGKYILENANDVERFEDNDSIRHIGYYYFSRVVFNENNQGCFYSSFFCGGECGGEALIFVEKKNGNWSIIDTWGLSQS